MGNAKTSGRRYGMRRGQDLGLHLVASSLAGQQGEGHGLDAGWPVREAAPGQQDGVDRQRMPAWQGPETELQ